MISATCCYYCKKKLAHDVQKGYEMIITGERRDEGGMRSVPRKIIRLFVSRKLQMVSIG